jgi:diguanylate cyclase (GGDEF)-like protein
VPVLAAAPPGPRRLATPPRLAAVAVVAWLGFLLWEPGSITFATAVNDAVQLLVPLVVAAPLAVRAGRRARGRARSAWWLLAGSAVAWGLGQASWTWSELVLHRAVPFPSSADVGFLAAVPLLIAAVVSFPAPHLRRIGRTRATIDGCIAASALLFMAFSTVLADLHTTVGGGVVAWLLAAIYPTADLLVLAVVLASADRRGGRWSGPLPLIGAGAAALAVADAAFAVLAVESAYGPNPVTDGGWPIGFLLIGLAALRAPADDRAARPPDSRLRAPLYPYLAVLPALASYVFHAVTGARSSAVVGVLGGCVVSLLVLRQVLTLLENRQLTDEMAAALATLRHREEELEHQAAHDPLTGLANRTLLRERMERALSCASGRRVAVLLIDLDDFKTVNDSLGHDVGDHLLVLVAERLRRCVDDRDTVARLGGDEFAVLVTRDLGDGGDPGGQLAGRLLEALEPPFRLAGRDLRVRASIGVVATSGPDATAEEVLQDADLAMYAAKGAGKGSCARFEPVLRQQAVDRLELVEDLQGAADRGELVLHFQPIVDLQRDEVIGQEALLRWQHPRRGLLAPDAFIPLAEEVGAIDSLGRWALDRACREAASWLPTGDGAPAHVAVNVSARQLEDPGFVGAVAATLARTGLPAACLALEITESVVTDESLTDRLRALRRLGVHLAIDDFGTGYSALSYLTRLEVDVVKIDRSFVERLEHGEDQRILVGAVVALARGLGLRVVGEGIETEAQHLALRELGCHAGQGYLLGRPAPVPAFLLAGDRVALGR